MVKKISIIYGCLILVVVLMTIYLIMDGDIYKYKKNNESFGESVIELDAEWKYLDKETVEYKCKIDNAADKNKCIAFFTTHSNATAYIGNIKIYSNKYDDSIIIKSAGYCYNIINITNEFKDKELAIIVSSAYGKKISTPKLYYGQKNAIQNMVIHKDMFDIVVSFLLVVFGIFILLYTIYVHEDKKIRFTLVNLALFSILIGLWRFFETSFCQMYIPHDVLKMIINHTCLMLAPIPFAICIAEEFEDLRKIFNICIAGSMGIVIIRVVLQMFGILDFKETLFLTQLDIIVLAVCLILKTVLNIKNNINNKEIKIQSTITVIIMLIVLIDVVIYIFGNQQNVVVFFLIYVVYVYYNIIRKNKIVSQKDKEMELYRSLAYKDGLTELLNRTAFEKDFDNYETNNVNELIGICMYDLNDLKKCNDNYGHQFGDEYILTFVEILKNVYSDIGRIYRIGGDEFCILINIKSGKEIDEAYQAIKKIIAEKNNMGFVVKISAAYGYSIYDPNKAFTMEDVKNKADFNMYECKRKQKEVKYEI